MVGNYQVAFFSLANIIVTSLITTLSPVGAKKVAVKLIAVTKPTKFVHYFSHDRQS